MMPLHRFQLILVTAAFLLGSVAAVCAIASTDGRTTDPDSLYFANHPRLMFTREEVPALREKVQDAGHDHDAYAFIRYLVETIYPVQPLANILNGHGMGIGDIPNLGLAAFLEEPRDSFALDLGRRLTLYIAEKLDPDENVFYSPPRLRALALGYDMFFENSPEEERQYVRAEIEAYVDTALTVFHYERWLHRPYLSNISTMIGASLGLAAICLDGETDPARVSAAIERGDEYIEVWLEHQLDAGGAYNEGAMYIGWSMRHLAYYFWARKRWDGYDYSKRTAFRNIEKWAAFATLPGGGAAINNINDAAYLNYPLARHQTYFDWAQTEWSSGLSAWLFERLVGPPYGHEAGRLADKAGTVLWNQNLAPEPPGLTLPTHCVWEHRGLYYYRTGWPEGESSDDVVFSLYSGKFQGGHAQEDQNSFTLYGYGERFAVDNGYGWTSARESEAHNMVLIDGNGQHHAGGSTGTDGRISEFLLGDYADYVLGDATDAYTTHSEFNDPGVPFPDDDWSQGYIGANPVRYAHRRVIVGHDEETPPYFFLLDDIQKDDTLRTYEWRMHTVEGNTVDISTNPIRISGESGFMDLYVLSPAFARLDKQVIAFDNEEIDPNSSVVSLSYDGLELNAAFLMFPRNELVVAPDVSSESFSWGIAVTLNWDGFEDVFLLNRDGDVVDYAQRPAIRTDAAFVLFRRTAGHIDKYLVSNASTFTVEGVPFIRIEDGRANVSLSGRTIHVDRDDAEFAFYGPGVEEVLYREENIPIFHKDGYVFPYGADGESEPPGGPRGLTVTSYPNPFNAVANVFVEVSETASARVAIYDPKGRLVKVLWNDTLVRGRHLLEWDGTNRHGSVVATGVYFLKVGIPGYEQTRKLVLLK